MKPQYTLTYIEMNKIKGVESQGNISNSNYMYWMTKLAPEKPKLPWSKAAEAFLYLDPCFAFVIYPTAVLGPVSTYI